MPHLAPRAPTLMLALALAAAAGAAPFHRVRPSGQLDFLAGVVRATGVGPRGDDSPLDGALQAARNGLKALLYPHPIDAEITLGDLAAYHPDLIAALEVQLGEARELRRRALPPNLEEVTLELSLGDLAPALAPYLATARLEETGESLYERVVVELPTATRREYSPALLPSLQSLGGQPVMPGSGPWFRRLLSGDGFRYVERAPDAEAGDLRLQAVSHGGLGGATLFLRDDDAQRLRRALSSSPPPLLILAGAGPDIEAEGPGSPEPPSLEPEGLTGSDPEARARAAQARRPVAPARPAPTPDFRPIEAAPLAAPAERPGATAAPSEAPLATSAVARPAPLAAPDASPPGSPPQDPEPLRRRLEALLAAAERAGPAPPPSPAPRPADPPGVLVLRAPGDAPARRSAPLTPSAPPAGGERPRAASRGSLRPPDAAAEFEAFSPPFARRTEAAGRPASRPARPASRPARPASRPARPARPASRPPRPEPIPTRPAPRPTATVSRPTRPAPRPTRPAPRPLRPAPRPTPPRDAPTLEQIGVSPVAARGQAATVLDSALYGGGSSTPAPTQDAESVEGELPGSGARPRSTRRPARPPQWELFAPGDRSRSETATPATARAAPVPPPGDGIRWQTFDDATEEGELP